MKRLVVILFVTVMAWTAQAQKEVTVTNKGDEIVLKTGMRLHIKGSYVDSVTTTNLYNGQPYMGTLVNGDTIFISKDIRNRGKKNVSVTDFGVIVLNGQTVQYIEGDSAVLFHHLVINKDNNLVPYQYIKVSDSLRFIKGYIFLDSAISGVDLGNVGHVYEEAPNKRFFGRMGKVLARNRNVAGNTEDIAGIGISLDADGSLGPTLIERQNGFHGGAVNKGINRFFNIIPQVKNQNLNSATIDYYDVELNGVNEQYITLWNSINNGVIWNSIETQRDIILNRATGLNFALGPNRNVFTLADSICNVLPYVLISPRDTVAICTGDEAVLDSNNPGHFYLWNTGAETQSITVSTPGKYYVRVTNANGCFSVDSVTVVDKPYPVVNFTQPFVCETFASVFTNTSTLADPEGAMAFHWDFGVPDVLSDTSILQSPTFTYATSGQFTVRLRATSDFDCVAETTKTYVVHPKPEAAFSVANNCFDLETAFTNQSTVLENIGAINYAITDYSWDFGDTNVLDDVSDLPSPTYTYLQPGVYTVKLDIETNAGCTDFTTRGVTIYPLPVPDFTFTPVCEIDSITFTNATSIESGTMTFAWDFGDGKTSTKASPKHLYEDFGTYNVKLVVSSDGNCVREITKQVEIYPFPTAAFTAQNACQREEVVIANTSSVGAGTITYLWAFGDGTTSTDELPVKSYTDPGTYTITLQVTSNKGCVHQNTQNVTIAPTPIADFTFNNVCLGADMAFINTTTVPSGPMFMHWDFGDGKTSNFVSPKNKYTSADSYMVRLTAANPAGCSTFHEELVTVYSLPVVPLAPLVETCDNHYLLDAGNAGADFAWTGGSTNQTLNVTVNGTYSMTVTDANMCKSTAATEVRFINVLEDVLPATVTDCGAVTLHAGNTGGTYLWSTGAATQSINVSNSGTYTVQITDRNGCSTSDQVEVTILPITQVDLGGDIEVCADQSVVLDAGVSGVDYLWSTGKTTKTIEVTASGNYSVTITNALDCSSSDEVKVLFRPMPIADFIANDVCVGNATPIFNGSNVASGGGNLTLAWDLGNGESRTGSLTSYKYDAPGSYDIGLKVTTQYGCEATIVRQVQVNEMPELSMPPSVSTCGDQFILDAGAGAATYTWGDGTTDRFFTATANGTYSVTVSTAAGCTKSASTQVTLASVYQPSLPATMEACDRVTLDAGNPGATYLWSTGATTRTIQVTSSGTYSVSITDQNGCPASEQVAVTINRSPSVELGPEVTVCAGTPVTLDAGNAGATYLWSTGETTRSISPSDSRTYSVEVTTAKGCKGQGQVNVTINPVPEVAFTVSNVCLDAPITLRNNTVFPSGQPAFVWTLGDGRTTTDRAPSFKYTAPGSYAIKLKATSAAGCFAEAQQTVTVNTLPEVVLPASVRSCDATAVLNAQNPGATFLWSTNATTQQISINKNGNYGVVVRNANGCTTGATTQVEFISVYKDELPASATACDEVVLNAANAGGSYLWSNGATTPTIKLTQSGKYSVRITDKNGCVNNDVVDVVVRKTPELNLGADMEVCADQQVILNAGTGMNAYKWTTGATSAQIQVTSSGKYGVEIIKDNCPAKDEIQVTINALPVVNLGSDGKACDEVKLDAGNHGSSYLWSTGSTSQLLVSKATGEYWVKVTNAKGCVAADTVRLTVVPNPVVVLPQQTSACSGESVTLNAQNENATYKWSTGSTDAAITVTTTGNYKVKVTNELGCTIEHTTLVTIHPKVEVNIGADQVICTGKEVTLASNIVGVGYLWKTANAILGNEATLKVKNTGQYWLEVTTAQGCVGADTMLLQVSADTVVSRFLVASEVYKDDTVGFRNISYPQPLEFLWKFGDGISSRQVHPIHMYLKAGMFKATLTASTPVCSNTTEKIIEVIDPASGRIIVKDSDAGRDELLYPLDEIISAHIFPNPFHDVFTLELEKAIESRLLVVFYDMNGKVWFVEEFESVKDLERQYNMQTLPSGMYVMALRTGDSQIIKRIIKK